MIRMIARAVGRLLGRTNDERPHIDQVAKAPAGAIGEVVFVHGLGGDSRTTWRNKSTGFFWPEMLSHEFPNVDVAAVGYNAAPSMWVASSMTLPEMAASVGDCLCAQHAPGVPVVFIAHSLGGLVVKQLLRRSADGTAASPTASLVHDCVGVIFLATPHSGAGLADWLQALLKHIGASEQLRDLATTNTLLGDLNAWYRDNAKKHGISTSVYYEKDCVGPFRIVPAASAVLGIEGVTPVPLAGDHFAVCKPSSGEAPVYRGVSLFLQHRFGGTEHKLSDIRSVEISDLQARIARTSPTPRFIRVVGPPGCGKTYFAMSLANRAISAAPCIHISEDLTVDPLRLIDALRRTIPNEVMRACAPLEGQIADAEAAGLVPAVAEALAASRRPVVVEGTGQNDQVARRLIDALLSYIPPTTGPQVITTSYERPHVRDPREIAYDLPPLSFRDAAVLMRSHRPALSVLTMTKVHERYSGHALSIDSWAASGEGCETGLPSQTEETFARHFRLLTPGARRLFLAVASDPDLAITGLMPDAELRELMRHGLATAYPCAHTGGVTHYVHHIAREACHGHVSGAHIREARIHFLRTAYGQEVPGAGPRLVEQLIDHGEKDETQGLILSDGREWIETLGLRTACTFLRKASVAMEPDSVGFFFCSYLSSLAHLFAGDHQAAARGFSALGKSPFAGRETIGIALAMEELECARRLGHACESITAFNALQQRLERCAQTEGIERHFTGVARFLGGHFLRHFGKTDEAYERYDQAFMAFAGAGTPSDRMEALHCLYGRAQCAQTTTAASEAQSCEGFVHETGSQFLHGLFALTEARALATGRDYHHAREKIATAKDAFTAFGSLQYFQRCCGLSVLIAIVEGAPEAAMQTIDEVRSYRVPTHKLLVLEEFLHALACGRKDREQWLVRTFKASLQSGNLAAAVAASLLYQRHQWPIPGNKEDFTIPSLGRDAEGKWQLDNVTAKGIAEAIDRTRGLYQVEDEVAGIFLFD